MKNEIFAEGESPLRVGIEGCELVIKIGINHIDGHDGHNKIPALKFDNREEWVRDVITELMREEEDGSSPISSMLDAAMEAALEQGSIGIAEDSFTFIGECPVCGEDCVPLQHTPKGIRCENCIYGRLKKG